MTLGGPTWRVTGISPDGTIADARRNGHGGERNADGQNPGHGRVGDRHSRGHVGQRRHQHHAEAGRPPTGSLTPVFFNWTRAGYYVGAGATHRPAGSDLIFGGAGTEIARNDIGKATPAADGSIVVIQRRPRAATPTRSPATTPTSSGSSARTARSPGRPVIRRTCRSSTTPTPAACGSSSRAVQLLDYTQGRPAPDPITGWPAAGGERPRRGRRDPRRVRRRHRLRRRRQRRRLRRRPGRRHHRRLGQRLDLRRHRRGRHPRRRRPDLHEPQQHLGYTWNDATAVRPDLHREPQTTQPARASASRCTASALLPTTDPDTRTSDGNVLDEYIYTPGQVQTATINVTRRAEEGRST